MKQKNNADLINQLFKETNNVNIKLNQINQSKNSIEQQQQSPNLLINQEYNIQYYEEFKRLYLANYCLKEQLNQIIDRKRQIEEKLGRIERKQQSFKEDVKGDQERKKKRFRRTAQQIQRKYTCEVQICQKCYGSQGSLQQHIKLKHPQLYQSKSNDDY